MLQIPFINGAKLNSALLMFAWYIVKDNRIHENLASRQTFNTTYDFIVVGAGAGGAVVASRLSEIPGITVLLLEYGGPETVASDIPAMDVLNILPPTNMTQTLMIEPQEAACFAYPTRQFQWQVHHALGGGTTLNGMFYNRGGPLDYDGWAKDYKATGWAFKDVLPFFLKSEDNTDPILLQNSKYHHRGGPLTVSTPNVSQATEAYQRLVTTINDAGRELGYPTVDLNNAENTIGVAVPQRTVRDGKRLSTAKAFLQPAFASGRQNLHILTDTLATRILFKNENSKHANGVEFLRNEEIHSVFARREIIVSAGTVNSAKLLLLSGLGPCEDLLPLGIQCRAELPVGQNLHDHVRVAGVDYTVNETVFTFWQDLLTMPNFYSYFNGKNSEKGPLASNFYAHQGSVLNLRSSVPTKGATYGPADIVVAPFMVPSPFAGLSLAEPIINLDLFTNYYLPHLGESTLNLIMVLNYVKSRGYVKLQSANPLDAPIINPRYLTDQDDVDRLIEAHRVGLRLGETEAFKRIGAKLFDRLLPGCELYGPDRTDSKYIECVVRQLTSSEVHHGGTCKMAGYGDPTAVVDPRLRVVGGVSGLRVADASICPSIPTGNLMAPTIMIGEKAAHMIKEDHHLL